MFHDGGSVNVDGARIKCWKSGGHGTQTFLEVVQNSCNPGFVELGNRLGKETLFKYINNFGFGKKLYNAIKEIDPAVIHVHLNCVYYAALFLSKLNKKIIYEHTEELKENEDRESESI